MTRMLHSLSDCRGKRVVRHLYPKDEPPGYPARTS
jgi:hypothetical protein